MFKKLAKKAGGKLRKGLKGGAKGSVDEGESKSDEKNKGEEDDKDEVDGRISNVPEDPQERLKMNLPDSVTVAFDENGAYIHPVVTHKASYAPEIKVRLTEEERETIQKQKWKALPWWKRLRSSRKEKVYASVQKHKFVRIPETTYLSENSTTIHDYNPFGYTNLDAVVRMERSMVGLLCFPSTFPHELEAFILEDKFKEIIGECNIGLRKSQLQKLGLLFAFACVAGALIFGILSGMSLAGVASLWFDPMKNETEPWAYYTLHASASNRTNITSVINIKTIV